MLNKKIWSRRAKISSSSTTRTREKKNDLHRIDQSKQVIKRVLERRLGCLLLSLVSYSKQANDMSVTWKIKRSCMKKLNVSFFNQRGGCCCNAHNCAKACQVIFIVIDFFIFFFFLYFSFLSLSHLILIHKTTTIWWISSSLFLLRKGSPYLNLYSSCFYEI